MYKAFGDLYFMLIAADAWQDFLWESHDKIAKLSFL